MTTASSSGGGGGAGGGGGVVNAAGRGGPRHGRAERCRNVTELPLACRSHGALSHHMLAWNFVVVFSRVFEQLYNRTLPFPRATSMPVDGQCDRKTLQSICPCGRWANAAKLGGQKRER